MPESHTIEVKPAPCIDCGKVGVWPLSRCPKCRAILQDEIYEKNWAERKP